MAPIISTAVARASPQVIWNTCLEPAKFELWDDDVETITDVSGECKNGTTFTMMTKEPEKCEIQCILSKLVVNKTITYFGTRKSKKARCRGSIILTPLRGSLTKIDHIFETSGPIESFYNLRTKPKREKEKNLEKMVSLSEEAQKYDKYQPFQEIVTYETDIHFSLFVPKEEEKYAEVHVNGT